MGVLYVVATPIGNLKDITLRALETLKEADLILAEDTRVTQRLLAHYEIKKPIRRYDEYARESLYKEIKKRLIAEEKIVLVTDAGTPGISDPGSRLVSCVREHMPDASVIPIPGPSALIAALSASGINSDTFTFLGYPPHKKGRETFFKGIASIEAKPVVFYESPHRIEKAFLALIKNLGPDRKITVARELTKIYEEIFTGTLLECQKHFVGEKKKGEFVLIIP